MGSRSCATASRDLARQQRREHDDRQPAAGLAQLDALVQRRHAELRDALALGGLGHLDRAVAVGVGLHHQQDLAPAADARSRTARRLAAKRSRSTSTQVETGIVTAYLLGSHTCGADVRGGTSADPRVRRLVAYRGRRCSIGGTCATAPARSTEASSAGLFDWSTRSRSGRRRDRRRVRPARVPAAARPGSRPALRRDALQPRRRMARRATPALWRSASPRCSRSRATRSRWSTTCSTPWPSCVRPAAAWLAGYAVLYALARAVGQIAGAACSAAARSRCTRVKAKMRLGSPALTLGHGNPRALGRSRTASRPSLPADRLLAPIARADRA